MSIRVGDLVRRRSARGTWVIEDIEWSLQRVTVRRTFDGRSARANGVVDRVPFAEVAEIVRRPSVIPAWLIGAAARAEMERMARQQMWMEIAERARRGA